MSDHPLIPPKCEIDENDFNALLGANAISHVHYGPSLCTPCIEELRCAYYEVEWRKRAERWKRIVFRDRWLVPANDGSQMRLFKFPKLQRYASEKTRECEEIAAAWREWGSRKD